MSYPIGPQSNGNAAAYIGTNETGPTRSADASIDGSASDEVIPPAATATPTTTGGNNKKAGKRQFKYLVDKRAAEAEAARNAEGALGSDEEASWPNGGSRKKVKKACLFCKRSHMPCEVARPCARCQKRGIAHLCRDEPTTQAPAPTTGTKRKASTKNGGAAETTTTQQQQRSRARTKTTTTSEDDASMDELEDEKGADLETEDKEPIRKTQEEEEEVLGSIREYTPRLPISLLLSSDTSRPNSSRRSTAAASSSAAAAELAGEPVVLNGVTREMEEAIDQLFNAKDKQDLERLLEDKVFELG